MKPDFEIRHDKLGYTVKPVLSGHSKRRPKLAYKTDYRSMQVKIIAEWQNAPMGAFCNTYNLHLDTTWLSDLCFVYFRVAA